MNKGINILDPKSVQFRTWLDSIADKRGADSTLTISQIYEMLAFFDGIEKKMDETILCLFDLGESKS